MSWDDLTPYNPDVWKGTSNKYRTVARLPEGKTGLEALEAAAPYEYRRIMEHAERQAADTYRRMYAAREGNQDTLTEEQWWGFKKAGGESSF